METTKFDAMTSTLAATRTRRGALRLLAAAFGLGSVAGLGTTESAAKRKKGKKGKKPRQTPTAPLPPPPPCQGQPDDTPCNGDGRCLDGRCNARPTCATSATLCANTTTTEVVDRACCSSICSARLPISGRAYCAKSVTGQPCYDELDCSLIADTCRGYVCVPM